MNRYSSCVWFRVRAAALIFCLAGSLATCTEPPAVDSARLELARRITELAGAVPPEFGADAILQVVESGAVSDPLKKLGLLDEALPLADLARNKYKLLYASGPSDTRDGWLSRAYALNLDAESLKCRAVRLMVPLRPSSARLLLQGMMPVVKAHDCRSSLTRDPRIFYQTLSYVAKAGFTAEEQAKGEHIDYLIPFFSSASSPVQVVPLARVLLETTTPSPGQFQTLLGYFTRAVSRVPADDRAFGDGYGLMEAVGELADRALASHVACDELVASVRTYIVRNLAATRCADSVLPLKKIPKGPGSTLGVGEQFAKWSARFPPYVSRAVEPVTREEQRTSALSEASTNSRYWTSSKAKDLLFSVQSLRFGPSQKTDSRVEPLSIEARRGPDWAAEFAKVLSKMDSWRAEDEASEVDYFFQKCDLYTVLIELLPRGDLQGDERTEVLRRFVAFLTSSRLQQDDPVVWFRQAWDLVETLRRSTVSEAALGKGAQRDVDWVLSQFEQSGSVVLTLRAWAETLRQQDGASP